MSWWTTVDGLVLPRELAGHPALELVNSRSGWGTAPDDRQEYLRDYDHLVVLAHHHGLLEDDRTARLRRRARREPDEATRELDRARAVRRDLHDVVLTTAGAAARRQLAAAVGEARARQRFVVDDGGAAWTFPSPALADPVDAFLVAAGDLLVARPRVAACPGAGCGWLFVDPSGRRRWCQMAVCGNRAKQAAHARRTTGGSRA